MMGAGDGKLMAVVAGFLGFDEGLRAIGLGLFIASLWSVWRLCGSRTAAERFQYLRAYLARVFLERRIIAYDSFTGAGGEHRIPLAVCIAAGVCLYLAGGWLKRRGGF